MVHRLHIEDEGYDNKSHFTKQIVRAYCECGWLGEKVSAYDTAEQQARQQFYDHLEEYETINPSS